MVLHLFDGRHLMLKLTHAVVLTIFLLASAQTQAQTFAFGGSGAPGIMTLYFADGTSDRVDAIDQGWWSPTEPNFDGNKNTITGSCFGIQWNDFFVFDLQRDAGAVVSANLDLDTRYVAGSPMVDLWDVSTPLATLENLDSGPNAAIYGDLGSGMRFGGGFMVATSNTSIAIPLNGAGIAAVNRALGHTIAIGGSANQPIPEPAAAGLLAIAIAGLVAVRYRARQAAKRSALS
jgi:hypothetical protein